MYPELERGLGCEGASDEASSHMSGSQRATSGGQVDVHYVRRLNDST
jgi:hypothetical protein